MKKLSVLLMLSSLFLATILSAGMEQEGRILTSAKILKDAMNAPKTGITKELLHNAKAIAIFPNTIKSAFFIGGKVGKGVLSVKNEDGKWSDPVFLSMYGLSLGMQVGFQASDIIMIFRTRRSLDDLYSGKTTLGLDAGVVAFAKGIKNEEKTDEKLAADIQAYGKSSGLFVGVSVSGASLHVSDNDNFDYYDDIVYLDNILTHDKIKDKPESEEFKQVLYGL